MVKVLMNHARKIHSFANEQHEDSSSIHQDFSMPGTYEDTPNLKYKDFNRGASHYEIFEFTGRFCHESKVPLLGNAPAC